MNAYAIIQIRNTLRLAIVLKLVTTLWLRFAVRSGGHNLNPGFADINLTGFLLDLGPLNHVNLSVDKREVGIEPSARWGKVYETLEDTIWVVLEGA